MSDTMRVKVQLADKTIQDCSIIVSKAPPWTLTFDGIDLGRTEFHGDDLFEAMIALRQALEGLECFLLCGGARVDTYPSAMCRDMAAGRVVYVCELGMPADTKIDIFDYAKPELVGTVQQQWEFHQKWFVSIGKNTGLISRFWQRLYLSCLTFFLKRKLDKLNAREALNSQSEKPNNGT